MTLVTQNASFGASRDNDPANNDKTLAVLADSGSNINIIQQKDIKFWGIPETYENKPGFTPVRPYSSTMIRDLNVLYYRLCNLNRWDTHGNHQGHHAP
jgi:hypothetical protein